MESEVDEGRILEKAVKCSKGNEACRRQTLECWCSEDVNCLCGNENDENRKDVYGFQ